MTFRVTGGMSLTQGQFAAGAVAEAAPTVSNLAAHYDAQDFASLALSGSDVDTWNDLSGNGRNIAQTGATRPTYDATGANGLPSVRFADGTNQFFNQTPPTVTNTDKTVMVVMEASSVGIASKTLGIPYTFLGGVSGGTTLTHIYWPANSNFGINTFGGDNYGAPDTSITEDELFISTVYFDSGNMTSGLRIFVNETELGGLSQINGITSNLKDVGTSFVMSNDSFSWAGVIGELYMIDGLMDNTERADLITFLKTKWAIT